jgi:hypothetical protein
VVHEDQGHVATLFRKNRSHHRRLFGGIIPDVAKGDWSTARVIVPQAGQSDRTIGMLPTSAYVVLSHQ